MLWPRESGQPSDLWERFVVECKVLRDTDRKSLASVIECGVKQTLGYMAQSGHNVPPLPCQSNESNDVRIECSIWLG